VPWRFCGPRGIRSAHRWQLTPPVFWMYFW
jgi:hypothetical protein